MAPVTKRDGLLDPGLGTRDSKGAESLERVPELLARQWYWYYVLGLLTLAYVANVADRSQVLAASLQAIKREFNATDAQLGILSGLPFAIFYSFLGIPIAAWADRSSRRNVLAWSCALWSAATGVCGRHSSWSRPFSSAPRSPTPKSTTPNSPACLFPGAKRVPSIDFAHEPVIGIPGAVGGFSAVM